MKMDALKKQQIGEENIKISKKTNFQSMMELNDVYYN